MLPCHMSPLPTIYSDLASGGLDIEWCVVLRGLIPLSLRYSSTLSFHLPSSLPFLLGPLSSLSHTFTNSSLSILSTISVFLFTLFAAPQFTLQVSLTITMGCVPKNPIVRRRFVTRAHYNMGLMGICSQTCPSPLKKRSPHIAHWLTYVHDWTTWDKRKPAYGIYLMHIFIFAYTVECKL